MPRRCIWCESPNVTGEHYLLPRWAIDLVQKGSDRTSVYADANKEPHLGVNTKIKCVCSGCNSGWLSRLDEYASRTLKPHLETPQPPDRVVELTGTDLRLAQWAAKTLATRALGPRRFPFPDRFREFAQLTTPTRWTAWPFRLLASYGEVRVGTKRVFSYHIATSTHFRMSYRSISIGAFHFHLVWDAEGTLLQPQWDFALREVEAGRAAQLLPTTFTPRTILFESRDPVAELAGGIELGPEDRTIAALQAAIERRFGAHERALMER